MDGFRSFSHFCAYVALPRLQGILLPLVHLCLVSRLILLHASASISRTFGTGRYHGAIAFLWAEDGRCGHFNALTAPQRFQPNLDVPDTGRSGPSRLTGLFATPLALDTSSCSILPDAFHDCAHLTPGPSSYKGPQTHHHAGCLMVAVVSHGSALRMLCIPYLSRIHRCYHGSDVMVDACARSPSFSYLMDASVRLQRLCCVPQRTTMISRPPTPSPGLRGPASCRPLYLFISQRHGMEAFVLFVAVSSLLRLSCASFSHCDITHAHASFLPTTRSPLWWPTPPYHSRAIASTYILSGPAFLPHSPASSIFAHFLV